MRGKLTNRSQKKRRVISSSINGYTKQWHSDQGSRSVATLSSFQEQIIDTRSLLKDQAKAAGLFLGGWLLDLTANRCSLPLMNPPPALKVDKVLAIERGARGQFVSVVCLFFFSRGVYYSGVNIVCHTQ